MTSNIDVVITRRADKQTREILAYTLKQWGDGQERAYRITLQQAFERIREFPDIGHPIEGRPSNLRIYHLEHHAIEYRREVDRIMILRIINPRRRGQR